MPETSPRLVGRRRRLRRRECETRDVARDRMLGGDRAASVEAEPAEPKQPGAEQRQRQVVGKDRRPPWPIVTPRAEDHREDQRREARGDVDDRPAGEIQHAVLVQPAARCPDPMRERAVHERRPQRDEPDERRELHALGDRATDESRRDDGELALEHDEDELRDRFIGEVPRVGQADQPDERRVPANPTAQAPAERQRVADDDPLHPDGAHRREAVEHRGQHVLASDEAAIEERQAWHHQQHHRGTDEHPGCTSRIHRRR
jgi:hypothetical protein